MPAVKRRKTAVPTAVYLIVDTPNSHRSSEPGVPSSSLATFMLPIAAGETQDDTVGAFIAAQAFPPGSVFGVVDPANVTALLLKPILEAGSVKPGDPGALTPTPAA